MSKKKPHSFLERETDKIPYPGENLRDRVHAPFSTDLMNCGVSIPDPVRATPCHEPQSQETT